MENATRILVVCTHQGITETILRLINNNPAWHATGVSTVSDAEKELNDTSYELLLLGNGLSADEELQLSTSAKSINDAIKVIQHFGGGSGLLFAEIYEALGRG
ncbi:hypothetical protein [Mucilaginibacter sp.]|uniref:hypothetical protein n=1 Tax=Mucilaginibacter sp. TaxID=1882438 RepID=UPI0035BBF8BF